MHCASDNQSVYGKYALSGISLSSHRLCQRFDRGWFQLKTAIVLRKFALRHRQIVDAEPFGIKCRFYPHQNLGDRFVLFIPFYYEHEEIELLTERLKPGSTFIDIGANTGFYSLLAAKLMGQTGIVLGFEPNPLMFDRYVTNLKFNGLESFIQALPIGVSDKVQDLTLYFDPSHLGGATVISSAGSSQVKIHCEPLLDVLRKKSVTQVDVLKIDIEGYESVAMNHFFKTAPESLWPKLVIIETHDGIEFEKLGYVKLKRTHAHNSIFERY